MKLIRGVYVHSPWETVISHLKALKGVQGLSMQQRLAELYASLVNVTLAILGEKTLEWDYKLKKLITPKDFKTKPKQYPFSRLGLYSVHLNYLEEPYTDKDYF